MQKVFGKHNSGRSRFKTFDIDHNFFKQGFTSGKYDAIIAVLGKVRIRMLAKDFRSLEFWPYLRPNCEIAQQGCNLC